ncbi:MAG: hypothetical protein ACREIA_08725 [Opitutaceae bacterium]
MVPSAVGPTFMDGGMRFPEAILGNGLYWRPASGFELGKTVKAGFGMLASDWGENGRLETLVGLRYDDMFNDNQGLTFNANDQQGLGGYSFKVGTKSRLTFRANLRNAFDRSYIVATNINFAGYGDARQFMFTTGLDHYKLVDLGSFRVEASGEQTLTIRSDGGDWSEARLRGIRLVPASGAVR